LNKLRSILNYGEVKIRQHNLPLWLPTHAETSWQIGDATGNETHRYSALNKNPENYAYYAAF